MQGSIIFAKGRPAAKPVKVFLQPIVDEYMTYDIRLMTD
jgi:hypothetical protein